MIYVAPTSIRNLGAFERGFLYGVHGKSCESRSYV